MRILRTSISIFRWLLLEFQNEELCGKELRKEFDIRAFFGLEIHNYFKLHLIPTCFYTYHCLGMCSSCNNLSLS